MADVTLIFGRAGSGKSTLLRSFAAKAVERGGRVIYIVPEQFTFETERAMSLYMGEGLLDISVVSFTSLARRVLRETGERRVFLTPQGRRMAVRKCADECRAELSAFASVAERPGFAERCEAFFTDCKRFNVTPGDLAAAAGKLEEGSDARAKAEDLSRIYAALERHLAGREMDAEDALIALCARLGESSVAGADVIIDGFDLMSEQIYDIIGAMMLSARSLAVAGRTDWDEGARDAEVFAAEARFMGRIEALAAERRLTVRKRFLTRAESCNKAPALMHLEHEAFASPCRSYCGDTGGAIRLFAGTDRRAEAAAVADAVLERARAGVRYRDMAVIATDMNAYMEAVGRALDARGIPYFTDAKKPLASYGAARMALCALKAAAGRYGAKDILRLAKTGLAGMDEGDAEHFENYLLMTGIKGAALERPFREDAPPEAERGRAAMMGPLSALSKALSAEKSASGKTAALYEYFVAVGLAQRLGTLSDELRAAGRLALVEENAQVYDLLMELLSQLHAILGDAPVTKERFAAVFEEGIRTYEVGVIPTSADQLLFGSLGRSRARELDSLFILGASEGLLPSYETDDAMIDDSELALLANAGMAELPTSLSRTDKELSDVYGALTKPSRLLYLSYPMGAGDPPPCALIDRVRALFPDVAVACDLDARPGSPESGFEKLLSTLRLGVDSGVMPEGTEGLYGAFASAEGYRERLAKARRGLYYEASPAPFGADAAAALYGSPLRGSASRLESYYNCPFRHFARYGLRLTPRKEYREERFDEGAFCHDALDAFTKLLIEAGRPAKEYTRSDTDAMLGGIFQSLEGEHNGGVLLSSARNRALLRMLEEGVRETAWAAVKQLALGGFNLESSETAFGDGEEYPAIRLDLPGGRSYVLSGRIDRIDGFTDEDGVHYVRTIDYKSGGVAFSYEELHDGVRLQLPIYLAAVLAAGKARRAAGMYYMFASMPRVAEGDGMSEAAMEKAVLDSFRLSGLTLDDARIERLMGGSAVIKPRRNREEAFLSAEGFTSLTGKALDIASEAAGEIALGRADARPYKKKDRIACKYCDYGSLCTFDTAFARCAYRRAGERDGEGGGDA